MKIKQKNLNGVIAMSTMSIIMMILIVSGTTLLLNNIDATRSANSSNYSVLTKLRAQSCLEEGLYRLKTDSTFTGSLTIEFSDGECQVQVTNDSPGIKRLQIQANIGEYYHNEVKLVDVSEIPFTVTN